MGAQRKHPQKDAAEVIERLAAEGRAIIGIAKHLGVSRETFKAWCERDESLQEAFEIGRDEHRQYLVVLLMQAAASNKGTNANAMFLLKTMHGFRETDTPNSKIDVGVSVTANVLVVKDHGSDAEWEAKAVAQQRALLLEAASPPKQIKATVTYVPTVTAPWIPAHLSALAPAPPAPPAPPPYAPHEWRGNT
jgi:hypothetical protein